MWVEIRVKTFFLLQYVHNRGSLEKKHAIMPIFTSTHFGVRLSCCRDIVGKMTLGQHKAFWVERESLLSLLHLLQASSSSDIIHPKKEK